MIKKYLPFLLVYLCLHLLFFSIQIINKNYFLSDSSEYLNVAKNLKESGVAYCGDLNQEHDVSLYTKRPPGYPVLLVFAGLLSNSLVILIIIQAILSLISAYLLLKIFHQNKNLSYLFAVFLLFYPSQFIYANLIMSEILFQTVIMLSSLMILRYIEGSKNKYLWIYTALLCIGILIKPILYIFALVNFLFIIYLSIKNKSRLVMISGLIPLIFILILGGINQSRTGLFHISSIQQVNIIDYNIRFFIMEQEGFDRASHVQDSIHTLGNDLSFPEESKFLKKEAKKLIQEKPVAFAVYHLKGMIRFMIDPGRFDIYNFLGKQTHGNSYHGIQHYLSTEGLRGVWTYFKTQPFLLVLWILLITMLNTVKTVGFIAWLLNPKIALDFRIYIFLIVGTFAFAAGPLGAARLALPVNLLIIGAAVVQYHFWINKLVVNSDPKY